MRDPERINRENAAALAREHGKLSVGRDLLAADLAAVFAPEESSVMVPSAV